MVATWGDTTTTWGDVGWTWTGNDVSTTTYYFTPPAVPGRSWAEHFGDKPSDPADQLLRHYGTVPTAQTVWQDAEGAIQFSSFPADTALASALAVWWGGERHRITEDQRTLLIAAGYESYIDAV